MQVAIPVWNDRVSPVFDSASTLVILRIEAGRERARTEVHLSGLVQPKLRWLIDHRIDVLVCGAISAPFAQMLVASGTSVIAWVCGDVDEVVEALLADALPRPDLTMPGCCGRRMRARRRRSGERKGGRGGGRGRGRKPTIQ